MDNEVMDKLIDIVVQEFSKKGVHLKSSKFPHYTVEELWQTMNNVDSSSILPIVFYVQVDPRGRTIEEIEQCLRTLKVELFIVLSPYVDPRVLRKLSFSIKYKVLTSCE